MHFAAADDRSRLSSAVRRRARFSIRASGRSRVTRSCAAFVARCIHSRRRVSTRLQTSSSSRPADIKPVDEDSSCTSSSGLASSAGTAAVLGKCSCGTDGDVRLLPLREVAAVRPDSTYPWPLGAAILPLVVNPMEPSSTVADGEDPPDGYAISTGCSGTPSQVVVALRNYFSAESWSNSSVSATRSLVSVNCNKSRHTSAKVP